MAMAVTEPFDAHDIPSVSAGDLSARLAPVFRSFLTDMTYTPPAAPSTNEQLKAVMQAEMDARGMRCVELERLIHLAISYVECVFPHYNFEEKTTIALYHWYLLYVDELAPINAAPLIAFKGRLLRRQAQLDPVLDALPAVFARFYDLYEPFTADFIYSSALEFITGTALEPQTKNLPLVRSANRFPLYLRELCGIGEGYAHMIFPKRFGVSIVEYIEAVPDMVIWINLSNDLLSFYKEELGGETATYVHLRAAVEKKDPMQVLAEIKDELIIAQETIRATLATSSAALQAWKSFEQRLIFWHMTQDRYRLKELNL